MDRMSALTKNYYKPDLLTNRFFINTHIEIDGISSFKTMMENLNLKQIQATHSYYLITSRTKT